MSSPEKAGRYAVVVGCRKLTLWVQGDLCILISVRLVRTVVFRHKLHIRTSQILVRTQTAGAAEFLVLNTEVGPEKVHFW